MGVARGQLPMGLGHFGQWIGRHHPDFDQALAACWTSSRRAWYRISLPGSAPGAPPSTRMPSARPRWAAARVAIRPAVGHQFERRVDRLIGADAVDGGIHPVGGQGSDPLYQPLAIEHGFGAQAPELGVGLLAGGADHPYPLRHRQLDGQKAHAARPRRAGAGFRRRVTPTAARAWTAVVPASIRPAPSSKGSVGGLGTTAEAGTIRRSA